MKQYIKHIKPYMAAFIIAPILKLAEVFADVLQPKLMTMIVNNGVANNDIRYVLSFGGIMILSAFGAMLCGVGAAYFSAKAAMSFGASVRKEVFEKVQKFSFANIDKFSTGSLITRLTNDITQLQTMVMMSMRIAIRAPGMFIGAVLMVITIDKGLALVVAAAIPVLVIALSIIVKMAYPRYKTMQSKLDNLNNSIQENLTNVRVIKSFVRMDFEKERFKKSNDDLTDASLSALNLAILNMPLMMLVMNATTIAVIWFGGNKVIMGTLTAADLIAFTTYIAQILIGLMMLSFIILNGSRAVASAKRISEVLEEDVDITDTPEAVKNNYHVQKGKIEFRHVDFKYNKQSEEKILDDISFVVQPGAVVGILGATGSGKSSLVSLIPRLYDVTGGEILVDGINVKDYTIKNLRDGVSMVLQKNVLFSGSIEENLKWGDSDATREDIIEAAKSSQAHDFVENFSNSYETELGQGGVNVSGGQKQRLCIARAMLKKPKIIILDDSTSAVDTATEARIRETFSTTLRSTTKVIIAQRITSVMDADEIIVLDDGKIVGIGTHDELMKSSKEYQEIYYSQKDREVGA